MSNGSELISVCTSVFNTEELLGKCLDSLSQQNYQHFEVIVVDDASPGDTLSAIKPYLNKLSIKYVRHDRNKGLFAARVTGIHNASGNLITFIDSDDYLENNYISTLFKRYRETNADIVAAGFNEVKSGQTTPTSVFSNDLTIEETLPLDFTEAQTCWWTCWGKLYKRKLFFDATGLLSISDHLIYTEDFLFLNFILSLKPKYSYINQQLYNYVRRADSTTSSPKAIQKQLSDIIKISEYIRKLYINDPKKAQIIKFLNQRISEDFFWYIQRASMQHESATEDKQMKLEIETNTLIGAFNCIIQKAEKDNLLLEDLTASRNWYKEVYEHALSDLKKLQSLQSSDSCRLNKMRRKIKSIFTNSK